MNVVNAYGFMNACGGAGGNMKEYMIDIIERTEFASGYDFEFLLNAFNQLVMDEGCSVVDFVWLAMERML